jgi:hypothetical protein
MSGHPPNVLGCRLCASKGPDLDCYPGTSYMPAHYKVSVTKEHGITIHMSQKSRGEMTWPN